MSVPASRVDEAALTVQTAAPMFAAGPRRRIVLWNDGAEALLGFGRRDVLGRPCDEVLCCPAAARRLCAGECAEGRRERGGAGVPVFEEEVRTRSGERIWVSVTTLLAASPAGTAMRVHVLRELGRQRRLEELLREVVCTASKLSAWPPASGRGGPPPPRNVTEREREVFRLLARGSSTAEIARMLGVTPRTARNHVQNLLGKLRVHSRLEAVTLASARGLV